MIRDVQRHAAGQAQPLLSSRVVEQLHGVVGDGVYVARDGLQLDAPRLDLRQIENVVEQTQQGLAGAVNRHGLLALVGVEVGVEQQARHADDRVHGRTDLVTHGGQELALDAQRHQRLVARLRQRLLGLGLAFNRVPQSLGHAVECPAEVADLIRAGGADALGEIALADRFERAGQALQRRQQARAVPDHQADRQQQQRDSNHERSPQELDSGREDRAVGYHAGDHPAVVEDRLVDHFERVAVVTVGGATRLTRQQLRHQRTELV